MLWLVVTTKLYSVSEVFALRDSDATLGHQHPVLKRSHLPVFVDPSHASGRLAVEPLAKAAVAVGADGLIVEVHNIHPGTVRWAIVADRTVRALMRRGAEAVDAPCDSVNN